MTSNPRIKKKIPQKAVLLIGEDVGKKDRCFLENWGFRNSPISGDVRNYAFSARMKICGLQEGFRRLYDDKISSYAFACFELGEFPLSAFAAMFSN
jgi:hypothetical protein